MNVKIKKQHSKQTGAALPISLILMVAMTILGVATLNGTRLAEKVSSNAQQKTIAFETAESALDSVHAALDLEQRLAAARSNPINPPPIPQVLETNQYGTELDQTNSLGTTVDLDTAVSIQYCGEFVLDGTEMDAAKGGAAGLIGYAHDVRAIANIANSRARADNVLRLGDSGPKINSIGSCVVPGV